MGVRTAAAKLGFRLVAATSNKEIIISYRNRLSMFSRRSNTTLAADINTVEKSSNLYLCFDERRHSDTNLVLRRIRLDGYNGDECDKEEELRIATAHKSFEILDSVTAERSVRLGSNILFGIGENRRKNIGFKNICWVDPSTCPVEFHISSPTETKIKSFPLDKSRMVWGVIDGKLYCFDNCFRTNEKSDNSDSDNEYEFPGLRKPFEVLDPEADDSKWQPLSGPPFIRQDGSTDKYSVLFLNGSKKILGWEDEKAGVLFCFDTRNPDNGWVKSPLRLRDSVPFSRLNSAEREDGRSVMANTLVIHDNHPKLGDFNLVFSYDCHSEPFLVSPFFISDKCDSFRTINGCIRLSRELCSEYLVDYLDAKGTRSRVWKSEYEKPNITCDSQFADLGNKRFCLILHKFSENDSDDKTKGIVLVLTFEYEVIVSDEIKMKTRLLETRRYNYRLKKSIKIPCATNYLTGAFMFKQSICKCFFFYSFIYIARYIYIYSYLYLYIRKIASKDDNGKYEDLGLNFIRLLYINF